MLLNFSTCRLLSIHRYRTLLNLLLHWMMRSETSVSYKNCLSRSPLRFIRSPFWCTIFCLVSSHYPRIVVMSPLIRATRTSTLLSLMSEHIGQQKRGKHRACTSLMVLRRSQLLSLRVALWFFTVMSPSCVCQNA